MMPIMHITAKIPSMLDESFIRVDNAFDLLDARFACGVYHFLSTHFISLDEPYKLFLIVVYAYDVLRLSIHCVFLLSAH